MQLHATATAPHRMPVLESDPWCYSSAARDWGWKRWQFQDREWNVAPRFIWYQSTGRHHWAFLYPPPYPHLMLLVPGAAFDPNPKKIDVDMPVAGNNWGLALGWSGEHLDTCDTRRVPVSSNSIPITTCMCSSNSPWKWKRGSLVSLADLHCCSAVNASFPKRGAGREESWSGQ